VTEREGRKSLRVWSILPTFLKIARSPNIHTTLKLVSTADWPAAAPSGTTCQDQDDCGEGGPGGWQGRERQARGVHTTGGGRIQNVIGQGPQRQ
jgi:hypothetical protein